MATGVAVANNYYAQPLLATIRASFHAGSGVAGLIVTASQIGYAVGLVFVLPLGDILERRKLVVVMSLLCAAGLVGAAASPVLPALFAALSIVGATSVVAQVLVAYSASIADDRERGRVVGSVMSGLLLGVLLARTAAGYLAELGSWRTVYFVAAALMVILAVVMWRQLPSYREAQDLQLWRRALVGDRTVQKREDPQETLPLRVLLVRCLLGVVDELGVPAGGSALRYGTGTIGLFGLAGAAVRRWLLSPGDLPTGAAKFAVTISTAFAILRRVRRALVVRARAGRPHSRDRRSRPRLSGNPHLQPERDLQARPDGTKQGERHLHDLLFRRRDDRLDRIRRVLLRRRLVGGVGSRHRIRCGSVRHVAHRARVRPPRARCAGRLGALLSCLPRPSRCTT